MEYVLNITMCTYFFCQNGAADRNKSGTTTGDLSAVFLGDSKLCCQEWRHQEAEVQFQFKSWKDSIWNGIRTLLSDRERSGHSTIRYYHQVHTRSVNIINTSRQGRLSRKAITSDRDSVIFKRLTRGVIRDGPSFLNQACSSNVGLLWVKEGLI